MGEINTRQHLKQLKESSEFQLLNNTTRQIYELIYRSFLSSLIKSENCDDWKDEIGVYCRYNQSLLAKKVDKSLRTVSYAFKKLKDMKLIHVVEQGKRQTAKIYVKPVSSIKDLEFNEVFIENNEVKEAFEETFNESANYKEAKSLNKMLNIYSLSDLVLAIKKSVNVRFKKARISYITKTIKSLKNQKDLPTGRIIRKELVPDWLKSAGEADKKESVTYELTEERKNLISKIQDMSSLSKDINLYSNEEIETIIKMQEMKNMLL